MNKMLAILLFVTTVLFICGYTVIDRANKDGVDKHFFTIKETYNLFNDENLIISVYDNQNDTLIVYAYKADAYLMSMDESVVCKVKVESVVLNQQVLFEEDLYNEYQLVLSLDVNELSIENAILRLEYPNQEVRLHVGDVNYLERPKEKLSGIRGLYGLTFNDPFLSIGGIVLTIENSTDSEMLISDVRIGSNHGISIEVLESFNPDTTEIRDVCDYQYNFQTSNTEVKIAANTTKTLLFKLIYDDATLLRFTPIILNVNDDICYIDTFNYVISNDLSNFKSLIYEGYIYEF